MSIVLSFLIHHSKYLYKLEIMPHFAVGLLLAMETSTCLCRVFVSTAKASRPPHCVSREGSCCVHKKCYFGMQEGRHDYHSSISDRRRKWHLRRYGSRLFAEGHLGNYPCRVSERSEFLSSDGSTFNSSFPLHLPTHTCVCKTSCNGLDCSSLCCTADSQDIKRLASIASSHLPWLFKMDMLLFLWLTILGVMAIMVFAGVFVLLVPVIEESEGAGRV